MLVISLGARCAAESVEQSPPRQLGSSTFHYPEELWDAGVEGQTMLRLYVTVGGGVDSARVHRSSGHAAFDSAAVRGSRDLRFEPAQRGDQTVAAWVDLPVRFELNAPVPSGASPPSSPDP
jgi:protein TonB